MVGLIQSEKSSQCQHYHQHSNVGVHVCVNVCVRVCESERVRKRDEHLESFAASPSFPQRSLNRENDMFSH